MKMKHESQGATRGMTQPQGVQSMAQTAPVAELPNQVQTAPAAESTTQAQEQAQQAAQEMENRLRIEFDETLRLAQERATQEQAQTVRVLRKERAEAAAAIALAQAGARSLKAARALLMVDAAGFEGAEEAEAFAAGLQAQIDALKTGADTGFLFASTAPALRGFIPAEGRDEPMGDVIAPISLCDAVRMALTPSECGA